MHIFSKLKSSALEEKIPVVQSYAALVSRYAPDQSLKKEIRQKGIPKDVAKWTLNDIKYVLSVLDRFDHVDSLLDEYCLVVTFRIVDLLIDTVGEHAGLKARHFGRLLDSTMRSQAGIEELALLDLDGEQNVKKDIADAFGYCAADAALLLHGFNTNNSKQVLHSRSGLTIEEAMEKINLHVQKYVLRPGRHSPPRSK